MADPFRLLAFLIGALCVALALGAVFSGSAGTPAMGELKDTSLYALYGRPPGSAELPAASLVQGYVCPACGARIEWGSEECPQCGWRPAPFLQATGLNGPPGRGSPAPAAVRPDCGAPSTAQGQASGASSSAEQEPGGAAEGPAAAADRAPLPSPREQNSAGKAFVEGHWLGLEVLDLTPALAREYGVPGGESGVLVDEITLEAAESGILAGDVVQAVNECPTPDLKAFFLATQHVADLPLAEVGVRRRGEAMTFTIRSRNTRALGFAQMEAAQPIVPGALRPHASRGRPCTDCHIIMRNGGQLPKDAGDLLREPPPISAGAKAPHGDRGRCSSCHVIK